MGERGEREMEEGVGREGERGEREREGERGKREKERGEGRGRGE